MMIRSLPAPGGLRRLMSSSGAIEAAVLGPTAFKQMPWKNGKGVTTEIAIGFADGILDFSWRISRATVAEDGPFSVFGGVDRNLTVLPGGGGSLELRVEDAAGAAAVTTLRPLEPFSFAGDAATTGFLIGGAIDDFNVMTRRGLARINGVRVVEASAEAATETQTARASDQGGGSSGGVGGGGGPEPGLEASEGQVVVVYCIDGEVNVAASGDLGDDLAWSGGERWAVPAGHALVVRSGTVRRRLAILGAPAGRCIRVDMTELARPAEK
jgi:environmental stress-induced protein Ves